MSGAKASGSRKRWALRTNSSPTTSDREPHLAAASRGEIPVEEAIAVWRKDADYMRAYDALESEFALAARRIAARMHLSRVAGELWIRFVPVFLEPAMKMPEIKLPKPKIKLPKPPRNRAAKNTSLKAGSITERRSPASKAAEPKGREGRSRAAKAAAWTRKYGKNASNPYSRTDRVGPSRATAAAGAGRRRARRNSGLAM